MANRKVASREINREELRRYLAERGKVSYIFDTIEKLEDKFSIAEKTSLKFNI